MSLPCRFSSRDTHCHHSIVFIVSTGLTIKKMGFDKSDNSVLIMGTDSTSYFHLLFVNTQKQNCKGSSFQRCFINWLVRNSLAATLSILTAGKQNNLQIVAAFIICHTEADLHADCTCMNAHTHIIFLLFFTFCII